MAHGPLPPFKSPSTSKLKTDPVCRYHTSEVSCADAVEGRYLPTCNYLPPTLPGWVKTNLATNAGPEEPCAHIPSQGIERKQQCGWPCAIRWTANFTEWIYSFRSKVQFGTKLKETWHAWLEHNLWTQVFYSRSYAICRIDILLEASGILFCHLAEYIGQQGRQEGWHRFLGKDCIGHAKNLQFPSTELPRQLRWDLLDMSGSARTRSPNWCHLMSEKKVTKFSDFPWGPRAQTAPRPSQRIASAPLAANTPRKDRKIRKVWSTLSGHHPNASCNWQGLDVFHLLLQHHFGHHFGQEPPHPKLHWTCRRELAGSS